MPIIFYQNTQEKPEIMEENRNNGIFGVDRKQMWAVDGKQEIYLGWPNWYGSKHLKLFAHSNITTF